MGWLEDLFSGGENCSTSARLARIERKLDLIMQSLGLEEPGPDLEEVRALARDGRKIEAIKRCRELTGMGLKEAKEFVDGVV